MLKKIINILLVIVVILSLNMGAVCSTTPQDEQKEQITLTVWRLFDSDEVMQPLIDEYQASNPNIKINYVKMNYDEYELKTSEALAAGEGPDIWMIRNDWMPRHWKKLIPLTDGLLKQATSINDKSDLEIYSSKFPPVAVNDNIIDNKIYGIPLSIDTLALYYNLDIFNEKKNQLYNEGKDTEAQLLEQPPANWDDFISIVKILTERSGNNINKSAAALGLAKNIDVGTDIQYALMLQNGTEMVSADKQTATFNLSSAKSTGEPVYAGTKALEFYTNFANPDKEVYTWNEGMPNSVDAFMDGKTAMIIHYPYIQKRFLQERPTLNYAIGPLPQIKGTTNPIDYTSYWVETVTKNSQHPDEAWKFILYLAFNGNASYSNATKRPNPYSVDLASIPTDTQMRATWQNSAFEFQKMTAKDWYKGTRADKVDSTMFNMIDNAAIIKQPYQKAIDAAAAEVTKLLQESGAPPPYTPVTAPQTNTTGSNSSQ